MMKDGFNLGYGKESEFLTTDMYMESKQQMESTLEKLSNSGNNGALKCK